MSEATEPIGSRRPIRWPGRRKQRRILVIASIGAVLAVAVGLILSALSDQIVFFRTPTEMASVPPGERIRIGGLVAAGSVQRTGPATFAFQVTDTASTVPVVFEGVLPDLFREGQGVVAEGVVADDGRLMADTVLARHDENYVPREVVDALRAQGVWEGDGAPAPAGAGAGGR